MTLGFDSLKQIAKCRLAVDLNAFTASQRLDSFVDLFAEFLDGGNHKTWLLTVTFFEQAKTLANDFACRLITSSRYFVRIGLTLLRGTGRVAAGLCRGLLKAVFP